MLTPDTSPDVSSDEAEDEQRAIEKQQEDSLHQFMQNIVGAGIASSFRTKTVKHVSTSANKHALACSDDVYQSIFNCIHNYDEEALRARLRTPNLLIDKKFLVITKDDEGTECMEALAALHLATQRGNVEFMKLFIDRGADVNLMTSLGNTPLALASDAGHIEAVKHLLHCGADPNLVDNTADPDYGNRRDGWTPLINAARKGHFNICAELLAHGADPNVLGGWSGVYALTYAVTKSKNLVALLLSNGADPNTRSNHMQSHSPLFMALMLPSKAERIPMMELLLANGADSNPARGMLADGSFAYSPHVSMLVTEERNAEIQSIMSMTRHATSLHRAAAENDMKTLQSILQSLPTEDTAKLVTKAPSEMSVKELKAAIHNLGLTRQTYGFSEKNEFVQLLENHYSSLAQQDTSNHLSTDCMASVALTVDARDRDGWTPLHLALFLGSIDAAQLLLDHGADPLVMTKCGRNAMHLVCSRRGSSVIIAKFMEIILQAIEKRQDLSQLPSLASKIPTEVKAAIQDSGLTNQAQGFSGMPPLEKHSASLAQEANYYSSSEIEPVWVDESEELLKLRQRLPMDNSNRVYEVLLKILCNIKKNPNTQGFRVLKNDNVIIADVLLANPEAIRVLQLAGFKTKESTIELEKVDLPQINLVISQLEEASEALMKEWNEMY